MYQPEAPICNPECDLFEETETTEEVRHDEAAAGAGEAITLTEESERSGGRKKVDIEKLPDDFFDMARVMPFPEVEVDIFFRKYGIVRPYEKNPWILLRPEDSPKLDGMPHFKYVLQSVDCKSARIHKNKFKNGQFYWRITVPVKDDYDRMRRRNEAFV